jgi:hypothetical protein
MTEAIRKGINRSMNPVRTSAPTDLRWGVIAILNPVRASAPTDLGGLAIAILKQVAQFPILGAHDWPHEQFIGSPSVRHAIQPRTLASSL